MQSVWTLQGCANLEILNAIKVDTRIFISHHLLKYKLRFERWQMGRKGTGSSRTTVCFRILFPFLLRKHIGQHSRRTSAVWTQRTQWPLQSCLPVDMLGQHSDVANCCRKTLFLLPLDPSKHKSQNGTAHCRARTKGTLQHFPAFSTGFGDKETRFKEIGWLSSN